MTGYMTDEYRNKLEYAYSLFGTWGSFTAKDIRAKAEVMNALRSKGYIKRTSARGPWKVTDEGDEYIRQYIKKPEKIENQWSDREEFVSPF